MRPRRNRSRPFAALAAGLAAALAASAAMAQTPVRLELERIGETERVRVIYPEAAGGDLSAQAEVAAGAVLVARFSEPIAADPQTLADAAPELVAMGRLDPDGRAMRLALNQTREAHVSVSHNVIAIDLAREGADPLAPVVSAYEERRRAEAEARAEAERAAAAEAAAPGPPLPVDIRTGEASAYTRMEFVWPETVGYALKSEPGYARLSFQRGGEADFTPLEVAPPDRVEVLEFETGSEGLVVNAGLAPGMVARAWDDGARVVLDIAPENAAGPEETLAALAEIAAEAAASREAEAAREAAETEPEPDAPVREVVQADPVPASGVVRAEAQPTGSDLVLTFQWASLPGAAVFRRGEALWIVFDAPADLDLAELGAGGRRHVRGFEALIGEDYAAARLDAAPSTQADVRADGAAWTVTLTDALETPPDLARIARDTRFGEPARIRIGLDGARSVRRIADPVVGDELLVLTGDGEPQGVISERRMVEALVFGSAHGVAVKPAADDLAMTLTAGGAVLTRPGGLALSRAADPALGPTGRGQPVSPGFLDFAGWRGDDPFMEDEREMRARASSGEPEPLLALARFYLGWELGAEALGAAELAVEARPELETDPGLKAIQGAARYMMGRLDEAETAFSHPALIGDAAAQPWRGLVAAAGEDWGEARRRFEDGRDAIFFYAPEWRALFRAAHARAALETNDLGAADQLLTLMQTDDPDAEAEAEAGLAAALLDAKSGRVEPALARLQALGRSEWEPIQARALLEKVRLEINEGRITPAEGAERLESLRYRWRGDATELEASRLLGEIYAGAGRYAQALEVMRAAQARFPDSAVARRIGADMDALFRRLYLEDEADRMGPIEALALYREYAFLTPIGSEGDRMVRRIAERLVRVDLLDAAAELLDHQVFERLRGRASAEVAADLAVIHLMNSRPQAALRVLRETRIAGLDRALLDERRLLEARALEELGRYDNALELIAEDRSEPARRLRADAAWDQRDWSSAGRRIEAILGERWRGPEPLDSHEAHDVLRAAIAYALADDEASVARLKSRYARAMGRTRHAAAFSLLAEDGVAAGDARLIDMVGQLADMTEVDAFMAGFADRFDTADPAES